jgi:hypothetical protein
MNYGFFKMVPLFLLVLLLCFVAACDEGAESGKDAVIALNEDFNAWEGGIKLEKGLLDDGILFIDDNDTMAVINEENALKVHAFSQEKYGSIGVEVQWPLLVDPTDMSGEDFSITFDVFVPAESVAVMDGIQFAFFDANYSCIYSNKWTTEISEHPGEWVTLSAPISNAGGFIGYNGFGDTTDEWIFRKARIQFATLTAGQEVVYYIDNLRIQN